MYFNLQNYFFFYTKCLLLTRAIRCVSIPCLKYLIAYYVRYLCSQEKFFYFLLTMGIYLCGNVYCRIMPRNLEFHDVIFSDMVLILDSRNMMHSASLSFINYRCWITSNDRCDAINFYILETLRQTPAAFETES